MTGKWRLRAFVVAIAVALLLAGVVLGRVLTDSHDNSEFAARLANHTALLTAQVAAAQRENVLGQRRACERTNVVRRNQAEGIGDQIKDTERALRGDLGALESFRERIRVQLGDRKRRRRALRIDPKTDTPDKRNPYLVDCVRAHPLLP